MVNTNKTWRDYMPCIGCITTVHPFGECMGPKTWADFSPSQMCLVCSMHLLSRLRCVIWLRFKYICCFNFCCSNSFYFCRSWLLPSIICTLVSWYFRAFDRSVADSEDISSSLSTMVLLQLLQFHFLNSSSITLWFSHRLDRYNWNTACTESTGTPRPLVHELGYFYIRLVIIMQRQLIHCHAHTNEHPHHS